MKLQTEIYSSALMIALSTVLKTANLFPSNRICREMWIITVGDGSKPFCKTARARGGFRPIKDCFAFPQRLKIWQTRAPEMIETGVKQVGVFRLYEDSRGDIWMVTTDELRQLFRWDRNSNIWHDHSAETGFAGNRIGTGFAEDRSGNLWIGTGWTKTDEGAALIRYRGGKFRVFTEADGLPSGWIRDLFVDHAGRSLDRQPEIGCAETRRCQCRQIGIRALRDR